MPIQLQIVYSETLPLHYFLWHLKYNTCSVALPQVKNQMTKHGFSSEFGISSYLVNGMCFMVQNIPEVSKYLPFFDGPSCLPNSLHLSPLPTSAAKQGKRFHILKENTKQSKENTNIEHSRMLITVDRKLTKNTFSFKNALHFIHANAFPSTFLHCSVCCRL